GGGAVVLEVDGTVRTDQLLAGLRRTGVRRIDVLVGRDGGRAVAEAVATLAERLEVRLVLVPDGHRVRGGSVPPVGSVVGVGRLELRVVRVAPRLAVEISERGAPSAARGRGPPAVPPAPGWACARTGGAPPRWRSWPPRPGRHRRSCRSRRSTRTRRAGLRRRSRARRASRR